jgi:nucleoside phosphorylase
MILIAAAMEEELGIALALCRPTEKLRIGDAAVRAGSLRGNRFLFLKTGVGPARSAAKLSRILAHTNPIRILGIGYCGALSPLLKLGDLCIAQSASLLEGTVSHDKPLNEMETAGTWELAGAQQLHAIAHSAGLSAHTVRTLTSPFIIGEPAQKHLMCRRFEVQTVDMETAALARTCSEAGIPFGCLRAISDEVDDTFLSPFTYNPGMGHVDRVFRVAAAGNWIGRLRQWKERAAVARRSLQRFLALYMDQADS